MEAFRDSKTLKKAVVVTVPIILIVNILSGITVISVIANKASNNPTSVQANVEDFKQSLEMVYEDVYKGIQSTPKKTKMKARSAPSLEFLSLLKPVVHLSGLDFDGSVKENTQTSPTVRNWAVSEGSERNLLYNGMTYEHGSITVPATGVYLIYSHVKFYVEDNKILDKQRMFNHSISRYNASAKSETLLLHNKVTECKEGINDGAHLEYPSNINSIVHLNAGDQITSRVSHFKLLKHDRDWHYIGAYLV